MRRHRRRGERRPDPVMAIVDQVMELPGVREGTRMDWERNRQIILERKVQS